MLKYFLNTDDVGIYSVSYNLASGAIQLPAAILLLATYPIIMETFTKNGEKETSLVLGKIFTLYFIFLTPAIFGIAALSKGIVNILLGNSFQAGYIVLPWVSAGIFCFGLTQYFYKPLELREKTKILSILVLLMAILNIILNLFFIPTFGILGAAVGTLCACFVEFFMFTCLFLRKSGVTLGQMLFIRREDMRLLINKFRSQEKLRAEMQSTNTYLE